MDNQKDKSIALYRTNKELQINQFFNNDFNSFLFKKTEKIATAVFLITNYIDPEEPIRLSFRKNATALLKTVLNLEQITLGQRQLTFKRIKLEYLELLSWFEIAFYAGLVSEMNFVIMSQEINSLLVQMDENTDHEKTLGHGLLEKDFFEVKRTMIKPDLKSETVFKTKESPKGHIKDSMVYKGHKSDFMSFINNQANKIAQNSLGQNQKDKTAREENHNERRDRIFSEIKNKGEVSIKDITDRFPDISEKTVQRELLKMVEENVLEKVGERRWSKYKIKGN